MPLPHDDTPAARTLIYKRDFTPEQENKSEERQIAACRSSAATSNLDVVDVVSDRGRAGTATAVFPALQQMLAAARRGECEVLFVEDLDRLSRNLQSAPKAPS